MMGIGSWDKPNRGSTQGIKCKGLCNNIERKRSSQPVARWTTKSQVDSRIKIKICSLMFLYSKERQFTTVGSRLQKAQSSHHQEQNTTPINRRSHQQTGGSKVLQ